METILQELKGVQVYLDAVIVAENCNDCATLCEVLQHFQEYGVHLNADKCKFHQTKVNFLGHRITAEGLQPKTENRRHPSGAGAAKRHRIKGVPGHGNMLPQVPLQSIDHHGPSVPIVPQRS